MVSSSLILLLLPAAFGFVQNGRWATQAQRMKTCANEAVKMASDGSSERNMFQDYDKPILLLGCSGEGKELTRLAESFLSENFPDVTEGVVKPTDNLLGSVAHNQYGWPNIIVVDFSDPSSVESDYAKTAKSLYEDGELLSIYVNVDSDEGNMSSIVKDRKAKFEEDVFIKYSDYELCIKGEGAEWESAEWESAGWEHIKWELTRL
jgi:hypothetical protein